MPLRILTFGLFGCGNFGNDGSLEAMLNVLRAICPEAEVTCVTAQPAVVAAAQRVTALPIDWPRPDWPLYRRIDRLLFKIPGTLMDAIHAFVRTRRADILIVPGTGILDDFRERPMGMPLALFLWCLGARLAGARIAFVSVGAGPIRHPLSRMLMKAAARMANYRSYRDAASRDFMRSIGCHRDFDTVYPDLAFALSAPPAVPPRPDAPPAVGVGIMAYRGWRAGTGLEEAIYARYINTMALFVGRLLDRGHRVRLLVGDAVDWEAVEAVSAAIHARGIAAPPGQLTMAPAHSLHDIMRQMADTELVVATRFHNVVCALRMGRPLISIGYAPKNDALMAEMGLEAFCQHVEQLDLKRLMVQFDALMAERAEHERRIRTVVNAFRDQLARQEAALATTLFADSQFAAAPRGAVDLSGPPRPTT